MTCEEAIAEIEGLEFAARLNMASSLATFLNRARREQAVQAIFASLDTPRCLGQVYLRTLELAQEEVDIRFENPRDVALAVYLWVTSLKDTAMAEGMAQLVLKAPQCWWATTLARRQMGLKDGKKTAALHDIDENVIDQLRTHVGIKGEPESDMVVVLNVGGISGRFGVASVYNTVAVPGEDVVVPSGSEREWRSTADDANTTAVGIVQ